MESLQWETYIIKIIALKTMQWQQEISKFSINDFVRYYVNVILNYHQPKSLMQAVRSILEIKLNVVIEYLNSELITNKTITLDDFQTLFENHKN